MGQRHQIYVVSLTDGKYEALGAFHHQWCYGMSALYKLSKAYEMLDKSTSKHGEFYAGSASDPRIVNTIIKFAYGGESDGSATMLHDETEHLIKDGQIMPHWGDNNDGCSLLVINNDTKQIQGCFFTPSYVEGEHYHGTKDGHNKAWDRSKYLDFYYSAEKRKDPGFYKAFSVEITVILNTTINPVSQKELNKILSAAKKEEKDAENKGA